MKRISTPSSVLVFLLFAKVLFAAALPTGNPEKLGFSPARLERLHAMIRNQIDQGKYAGAIAMIARNGKLVDAQAWGYRDLEAKSPMTTDTIVRIYSMSKVITSAAVLQLFEEGYFSLADPV